MPSIRIGLSTQFNLENEQVGIGTTNPTEFLEVIGNIKAEGAAGGSGVSTFREYQGFHQSEQGIANNIVIDNQTGGPFSSLSADLVISGETTISSGSTVEIGKTKTLTVTDKFAVPFGDTNSRDNTPEAGTTRFNQDFGTLEFFDGNNWKTVNSYARPDGAGRAVFGGGYAPAMTNMIEYIQTSTLGNSIDFGILTESRAAGTAMSSSTRGLFTGGGTPAYTNTIDYITIASAGNAIDFGDGTTTASWGRNGLSSSTRGLMGAGYTVQNIIDYVQIHTLGNALDFGDLTIVKHSCHGLSSPTRGLWGGGNNSGTNYNMIDSVIISSKGDAIDFGTLIERRTSMAGFSSPTRGIWLGGNNPIAMISSIEYVTIASGGNTQYFGEATVAAQYKRGNSSNTRGVNNGGRSPTITDTIEYVTIATAGNALDFGDLSKPRDAMGVASDCHGGLGGF